MGQELWTRIKQGAYSEAYASRIMRSVLQIVRIFRFESLCCAMSSLSNTDSLRRSQMRFPRAAPRSPSDHMYASHHLTTTPRAPALHTNCHHPEVEIRADQRVICNHRTILNSQVTVASELVFHKYATNRPSQTT